MAQTTILGRIGQLVRANINAMLDSAEDPEQMLDQLVRDFTNNIAEAEEAVAQTVGNLRLLEDDQREAQQAQQRCWVRQLGPRPWPLILLSSRRGRAEPPPTTPQHTAIRPHHRPNVR